MSRWLFPWSGSIKKRACRYLLQHYLGHFFQERLSLEQLSLDLYNGSGVIKEINIDVWAVNELLESLGAPLEIVDGFVSSIEVTIPWSALVTDHCTLVISGLQITCRPKYRTSGGLDSQGWSTCMTSSMQLAQECLKDPPEVSEEPPAPLEGLEMFAQTIETVLRRIKVTLLDTIIRIEHQPLDMETGIALEVHIKRLEYCDEAVKDPSQTVPVDIHQPPAFLHKILQLSSVQLLYETTGGPQRPLLIGSCSGFMETTVKIKQNDMLPGPKVCVCVCLPVFLSVVRFTSFLIMYLFSVYTLSLSDMFFSMGPGMTSSVTSALSGSSLSDSMASSTHSQARRRSQSEPLKPEALLRLSLGGLTLTLLEQEPYPGPDGVSSLTQVSQVFFRELAFFKDSMFSERDFHHLRASFAKACPHSHLRMTGAAVQVACEMRSAGRHSRAVTSDLSFSRLELLECLWEPGKPQYTEVGQGLRELHSSLSLLSPHAILKLRFPIPDLRPLPFRRPPSQRAVRQETLVLELCDLDICSQEGLDLQPDHHAPPGPSHSSLTQLLEYTSPSISLPLSRLSVRVSGGEGLGSALGRVGVGLMRDLGSMSFENPCELREKTSSPFSSNRTMFETEEMVIPADPEGMQQFQSQCVSQCQCVVDVFLPLAYIFLPSKQAFQSIYNRINNDLLMWEAPPPSGSKSDHSPLHGRQDDDNFQLCKSAFRLDTCLNTLFSLSPLLQGETGSPEDRCHGELLLDLEGGKMFSVAQHQNNPHLSFLCLESRRVELYHKAVVKDSPVPGRLEMPSFTPPGHLDLTIYPTELGLSSVSGRETEVQMLSTAIKITLDPQKNVKEFLVALRLHGATIWLIFWMSLMTRSWALRLLPLYLPLRVLFTAESFSLSSNIIVDTATFHLRFILDDSALFLSDKCENDVVDLRRDYVCVLDIDLLELAITTWKGSDTGKLSQPLFELRCSNNVVHLHTCADSCAALVNMLQYLVSQGDVHPPPRHTSPTEIAGQKLPLSESPASLPPCPPAETAEINQYDLLDALIDTERSHPDEDIDSGSPTIPRGSPVSVYLFPGEAPKLRPPVVIEGEESKLDRLVATAAEVKVDMMSEEGSDGSEDNEDFCILEAPGMGIPPRDGEPLVTVLAEGSIRVREGHFSRPRGSSDLLRAPSRFPVPESRVVLREVSVVWHLYGGRDFGGKAMGRSAPSGMRGSPSRSTAPSRPQNSWRWVGGGGREHNLLMEIQLTKVSFQHESYPVVVSAAGPALEGEGPGVGAVGEQPLSRQVFIVQELEVRDRLASSQLNKFLYLYTSESMPRRTHSNMLTVKALQVCPDSGVGGPECCLRVSLLPLRLNIDQDALFFLKDFFSSLAAGVNPYLPVDLAAESDGTETTAGLGPDLTASVETTYSEQSSSSAGSTSSTDQPIYFREFRFTSEVPIWLDYQGKHVVIEQGTFAGILIGLAQLNCSELKLKRLCCRHGLLGVDKVIQYAVTEWLTDIRKNQLPGILGGLGPMHSVVQLFHGVRDLFWMPIEQYRRDGRIIRGLQRGAASFGTSTASAALELSNRLVQAIQATAETVYDILSPTPPVNRYITEGRPPSNRPRRAHQPADLREGVAKAYDTVREGMMDTAQTLCDVASRGHEQKGLPGAVGGVLRQIPPTVVRPLIVASEATSNLLGGIRNQIKPDARKEDFLKWRSEEGQD
uniref:Autophagy related 2A n=1 Tax=Salmo trutta TaxID=8032 RepID=A0A674CJ14_SALTR